MTAREFLQYDEEWSYYCDFEDALYFLSQYLGKGKFYLDFPDAELLTLDGEPLEDMEGFIEYLEWHV